VKIAPDVLLLPFSPILSTVPMDTVLLLFEPLEILVQLLLTVPLEFAPVLDVLEKPTTPLAQALMNADLVLIAMEPVWPLLLSELLAPVETNVEDLEFATTDLVHSSTPCPLVLPAVPMMLASSELTVELLEPVLPTEMPSLANLMMIVPLLDPTLLACVPLLELTFALKEPVSLLTALLL